MTPKKFLVDICKKFAKFASFFEFFIEMEKIRVQDKFFKLYLAHSEILSAIDDVAARINRDFKDVQTPPILLCILNGAVPFTAELMKRLDFQHELVCMKVSSYQGMCSTGEVSVNLPPTANLRGRDIILCEDIVDTGVTIRALKRFLEEDGARSVKISTMLLKPERFRSVLVDEGLLVPDASNEQFRTLCPDYVAMEIPDDFIVGFGLDYNELGRHYKDIYVYCGE